MKYIATFTEIVQIGPNREFSPVTHNKELHPETTFGAILEWASYKTVDAAAKLGYVPDIRIQSVEE